MPALRIQGAIYHRVGPIIPAPFQEPSFIQAFFYDGHNYESNFNLTQRQIIRNIHTLMRNHNPFLQYLQTQHNLHPNSYELPDFTIHFADKPPPGQHERRYNAPQSSECLGILIGDFESENVAAARREVIIHSRDGELQTIPTTHPSYDPFGYGITHLKGDLGWYTNIQHDHGTRNVTMMDFYSYRCQIRDHNLNYIDEDALLYGGLLAQQYWIDQWVKLEEQRLNWIRFNQTKLKVELYIGLQDAIREGDAQNAGRHVILPSTHAQSPRNMSANYQDAMTIVGHYGKPTLFITVTCNPSWPEIKLSLPPGIQSNERPDITTRVFKMKLKEVLDDLIKNQVLGQVIAHIHVIEFQKRGLPHAHILLIMHPNDVPKDASDYDSIVCAELTNPAINPHLYNTITSNMIHACSHDRCMKNGDCEKKFPKSFKETTSEVDNSFPEYRRRRNDYSIQKNGFTYDNRHVVPYNPYLSFKYNCHINVEICSSIVSVKYLYKYVYKGHDRASIRLARATAVGEAILAQQPEAEHRIDEIKSYTDSRCVSAPEACWRIFGFHLGEKYPHVERLAIHLPLQQVYKNNLYNNMQI